MFSLSNLSNKICSSNSKRNSNGEVYTIIDKIIQFLQYDIRNLLGKKSDCCICCIGDTAAPLEDDYENCLENVRQPLPDVNEDDDCAPNDGDPDNPCENEEPQCQDEEEDGNHAVVCKEMAKILEKKSSAATVVELQCIEQRAITLWQSLNSTLQCRVRKVPNWWDLKSWQKLPFYWAALSNEILYEEPFENFKRFYTSTRQKRKRASRKTHKEALKAWGKLNPRQRLPFIMEAFISKVGAGKVCINDEHDIQRVMHELQCKRGTD